MTADLFIQVGGVYAAGGVPPNKKVYIFSKTTGLWTRVGDYPGAGVVNVCAQMPDGTVSLLNRLAAWMGHESSLD